MFDVANHLGAVTRAVEDSTHEGTPVKVVVASRTYPTDVDDLWQAVTDPERIPRWFAPVAGDLRLGGRFQVEGNAGGEVTACESRSTSPSRGSSAETRRGSTSTSRRTARAPG